MPTWCIVGASRGIGFEFVRQLLDRGDQVIAAVRDPYKASVLWQLAATQPKPGACQLCECDVTSEASINVGFHSWQYRTRADDTDVRCTSPVTSNTEDRLSDPQCRGSEVSKRMPSAPLPLYITLNKLTEQRATEMCVLSYSTAKSYQS